MKSSTKYQDYVDKLHSNNTDLVVEAAHALGDLGDRTAVPLLIELLETTTNPVIRNASAVGLRELGDERAIIAILSLLNDPKTEGFRGTLVYALEGFDCSCILNFLVDLVITGNFEVSHQAYQIIESIDSKVDEAILASSLKKVEDALPQAEYDRASLLKELIELLNDINFTTVS